MNSNISFPSPTVVVAHAYYLGQKACNASYDIPTIRNAQQAQNEFSVSPTAGDLEKHLESFTFSAATSNTTSQKQLHAPMVETSVPIEARVARQDNCSDQSSNLDTGTASVSSSTSTSLKDSIATSPALPRRQSIAVADVPFSYIHSQLRNWGRVYLGNTSSADAFINPLPCRRSSMVSIPESVSPESPTSTTIRARVLPIDKDRKPFLLRRQFVPEELRAAIPSPTKAKSISPVRLRRSGRIRRASAYVLRSDTGSKDIIKPKAKPSQLGIGPGRTAMRKFSATSIQACTDFMRDVTYALHYLPVLAALLLSGHIRKGDTIDLPVPHPEAWAEVVEWVYTGSPAILSHQARENIGFLGGMVDAA